MATFTDHDRRALRAVAVQFWINGVVFASFLPRLPEIRDRVGVDLGRLGLLLTLGTLGGFVGSWLSGPMAERLGTKTMITIGSGGLIVSLPIIGLADTQIVLLLGLVLMHLFDVVTDVGMNLQGSWLSARRHAPVMNRLHGLWSLGTVVGGLAATVVAAQGLSIRTHLLVVALILLATFVYVVPGLLAVDESPTAVAVTDSPSPRPNRSLALTFAVLAVGAIAVEIVPNDWSTFRLATDFDVSAGWAGLGFVAFTTGMVGGRFSGDAVLARLGHDRLLDLALVFTGVGLAAATLIPSDIAAVIGFFVAGLGVAVLFPRLYDRAAQAPGRPGAVLGAMTAGIRAGAFALPVTVGALASTDAVSVGGAMAIVTLPAVVLLAALRRR